MTKPRDRGRWTNTNRREHPVYDHVGYRGILLDPFSVGNEQPATLDNTSGCELTPTLESARPRRVENDFVHLHQTLYDGRHSKLVEMHHHQLRADADPTSRALHRAASTLHQLWSAEAQVLCDERSEERCEIEAFSPVSHTMWHTKYRNQFPDVWNDVTPGGGRDGLLYQVADRAQAHATRCSQQLTGQVSVSAQGQGPRHHIVPPNPAPVRDDTLPVLRSCEFCSGAIASIAQAQGLSTYIDPVAFIEQDPEARQEIRRRYPSALIFAEGWAVTAQQLDDQDCDGMHASTPCTAFSRAGKGRGFLEIDANLIQHATHLARTMRRGEGAIWFSYENVLELRDYFPSADFEAFMVEALPNHHISVGIVQAATTVDPYVSGGAALVSHKRLWCIAVLKKYFHDAVEVGSMEQCFPAKNAEDIRERDGGRSATYDFMPKHDQHFLRPEGKLIHPRGAPYYLVASLAQAKPGIGTAYFPSKVIDLTRGLLNTLTTGSFPWIQDTIEGEPCIRLLTLCEAFRAYRTRVRWPPLGANNDSEFWRRQLAQSIPQNVAAAITYIIELALLRPDSKGKSALSRIRDNTPLDLPVTTQAKVEALVQACFQPRDLNPFPQRRKYGVCWQETLDALTLRHPEFQGRGLCSRYQINVCEDGPECGLVHLCHLCLIRHPHDQECPQARAWRQTRGSDQTPEQVKTHAFHRLTAPLGIWDPMVLSYARTPALEDIPRGRPQNLGTKMLIQ